MKIDQPGDPMRKNLLYLFGILIAVAWLWNNKIEAFSPNLAEAIGFNLFSVGLPLLLLWYVAREMYRRLKEQGSAAPYKLIFGSISCICALLSMLDAFNSHNTPRIGAVLCLIFYGTVSAVLFGRAHVEQRRIALANNHTGASIPEINIPIS
jgi:hypothetical protein